MCTWNGAVRTYPAGARETKGRKTNGANCRVEERSWALKVNLHSDLKPSQLILAFLTNVSVVHEIR